MTIESVMSGDAEIFWEETGTGEALILLHGNGESGEIWRKHVPELSRYFRVLNIDSRGHGRSSQGMDELILNRMARDVIAVMDASEISRGNILGFSDGGNMGLILAVRNPDRVKSLITIGANATPNGLKTSVLFPMWLKQYAYNAGLFFSKEIRRKKELLDLMIREPNLRTWQLNGIEAPCLIVAGEKDMIRRSHTEYLKNSIPGAEMYILSGGHFASIEKPESIIPVILEFLRRYN